MTGPALGNRVLARSGHTYLVYLIEAVAALSFIVLLAFVRRVHVAPPHESATLKSLADGIGFVWRTKVVLGAMALDMIAVLLGSETALIPVYAKDILQVDEVHYGWLL